MKQWFKLTIILLSWCGFFSFNHAQLTQFDAVGGFEGSAPAYWSVKTAPVGSTLEWATDQSRSLGRSLKITKTTTSEAAVWESENMTDIWSPQHLKAVDIFVGAYVRTSGVNINPANDDQRWYISYLFYDSAGVLMGETKLPVPQTLPSSLIFLADTNSAGQTILPRDSWKTIIRFVGGKDATGTVWADDFMLYGRGGAWAGQNWNTSVGVPTGWYYWLPPNGGNDGILANGFENTRLTNAEAHTGTHSLLFDLPANRNTHDGFVSTRRFPLDEVIQAGDQLQISVWIKGAELNPDSAFKNPGNWSVGFTPIFHSGHMNNDPYNEIDAHDYTFAFPRETSFDWTLYTLTITVPNDPNANAFSVRLHVYARMVGKVWFDDLQVRKLSNVQASINDVGMFEGSLPSYWTMKTAPSGSTLEWASDQSRNMGRSLKITKTTTSEAAVWESENMTDIWSPQHLKAVDIFVGAYVRTSGVNINPANDDQRWYISYLFYDSAGVLMGETKLPIPQSSASTTGFVADTNSAGQTILPRDSWKTIIRFVGGKDATGTVWADDFMLYGRGGAWAGQNWNTSVGVPTGWYYWLPPNGGNDGKLANGFENTRLTNAEAHTGTSSLLFDLPANRNTHDGFVSTRRYPLDANVMAGDQLQLSVWIKSSELNPDSAFINPGNWSVGFTPIFHSGYMNNDPYNEIDAHDYTFVFPNSTSFDWTLYTLNITVPADPNAHALSVRLHVYARMVGKVWFDDLQVAKINPSDVKNGDNLSPVSFSVYQNYPNPFNPTTTINYSIPKAGNVSLKIYDMLGKEVRSLIESEQGAGMHSVLWDGNNNYGGKAASGTYIFVVRSGEHFQAKKMTLLK